MALAPWVKYQGAAQPETTGQTDTPPWVNYQQAAQGRQAASDESAPGQVQPVAIPASTSPQADYKVTQEAPTVATSEQGAFARGLEDGVTFGGGKKLNALGGALVDHLVHGKDFGDSFNQRYAEQKALEAGDAKHDDVAARLTGQVLGIAPTMLIPGLPELEGARAATVGGKVVNALSRAGSGAIVGAGAGVAGSEPGQELENAGTGAAVGAAAGTILPAVVGTGSNVVRRLVQRFGGDGPVERAANALTLRAPQDVNALTTEIDRRRQLGFNPTLADVVDQAGAGVVRDAASRPTPAREVAQDFYDARRENLPGQVERISQSISPGQSRPVHEVIGEVSDARKALADEQFTAVRGNPIQMSPEVMNVLGTSEGQNAIRAGTKLEYAGPDRDALTAVGKHAAKGGQLSAEEQATLAQVPGYDRMSPDAQQQVQAQLGIGAGAAPTYTVGHAQRISEMMLDAADNAAAKGQTRRAAILRNYGRTIRDDAAGQSQPYQEALGNYAAQSGLIKGAEVGDGLLKGNTDEFVRDVSKTSTDPVQVPSVAPDGSTTMSPGPSPRDLARSAARRNIDLAAGEGPRRSLGLVDKLGRSSNALNRLTALTDAPTATTIAGQARVAGDEVRRAGQIAPNTGSQTFGRMEDRENNDLIDFGLSAATGGKYAIAKSVAKFLTGKRIGNVNAENLVNVALDPNRTDEAIAMLKGAGTTQQTANKIVRSIARYGRNASVEGTTED